MLAAADEPEPEQPAAAGDDKDEEVAVALHDEAAAASAATDFSAQARTEKPKLDIGSGESPKVANDNRPAPRQEAPPVAAEAVVVVAEEGEAVATAAAPLRATRRHPITATAPPASRGPCIFPTSSPATGWRYRWRRCWPAPPIPTATA